MATRASALASSSSSLFTRLANAWRLLSLRSDVDNIILELLGHFSLEKVHAERDKEAYQHLVITLLAQLNAIFYIQRISLPSENQQANWYLGFLASWEVTVRSVEFVLQVVEEGRESLWEARLLRDKYLAELLLSALRVLTLHPRTLAQQRAKDRRERFAQIHRSLERVYDSHPGPKSFLLLVCKEITNALRTDPNALALPTKLNCELPNLASELYPLADCLSAPYVSTIVPKDGFFADWLSQFLALRDVSQFVVAASVQYTVNRETRDVHLQSTSAKTRNAVLHALESIRIPPHLSRVDMVAAFSETFRIILPDTPNMARRNSSESLVDENEIDAIDSLCTRLNDRHLVQRVSDREIMHSVSEIMRNIALLDDPSGQFRTAGPRLYVMNCQQCHLVGESQLRNSGNFKLPMNPIEASKINLPPQSKCIQCGEEITILREISLARRTWDLLNPLESNIDTINAERHLPSQFRLAPLKVDKSTVAHPRYSYVSNVEGQRSFQPEPSPPYHGQSPFQGPNSPELHFPEPKVLLSPVSPSFHQEVHMPRYVPPPSENYFSNEEAVRVDTNRTADDRRASNGIMEPPFSPDFVVAGVTNQPQFEQSPSVAPSTTVSFTTTRSTTILASPPEKGKSRWRPKLPGSRKDSAGASADTSSLSSTTLESQRLEEVSLKSLTNAPKKTVRGKGAKNINVYLSQNSTYALFWTQASIHIFDVGTSPPTLRRAISTESTCVLAAITKIYLAYIIGTRDQKLTLRIINITQPSTHVVEYRMPSSLWCSSITICPKENYVVVGFENSVVRFFKTTNSEPPREDRLHGRHSKVVTESPPVDTLSFSNDGLVLLASTRNPKSGLIQIYSWRFPFLNFEELQSCRYLVPLHESEDNGTSSAVFRSGPGAEENLVCITTWTQSGVPILVEPEGGHRSDIRTDVSSRQGRLGSRIQGATFSPSGRELAMINDKGHVYQISSLNSNPMDIRRIASSKELTSKSDSFAIAFMTLPDEEAIVLAWADSSKATGFVKKIPIISSGDADLSITSTIVNVPSQIELPESVKDIPKQPVELAVTEVPVTFSRIWGISEEGV